MSASDIPTAVAVCEYICKSIVSDPDAVDVEVDGDDGRYELTVTVGDGDTGRVIGRRGRTPRPSGPSFVRLPPRTTPRSTSSSPTRSPTGSFVAPRGELLTSEVVRQGPTTPWRQPWMSF